MKSSIFFCMLLIPCLLVGKEFREVLCKKIWESESKCSYEKLVFWNPKEPFPSLGIGHFIWFPKGKEFPFVETFPMLLSYLEQREINFPTWLKEGCPWQTREEFENECDSEKIKELRQFLYETRFVQTDFIVDRFQMVRQNLEQNAPQKVKQSLQAMETDPLSLFAMIDYVHFKGDGTDPKERYQGEGWGLLQVLLNMPQDLLPKELLPQFINSAKVVLARRVQNSPQENVEQRWLPGWYARIEKYGKGVDHLISSENSHRESLK